MVFQYDPEIKCQSSAMETADIFTTEESSHVEITNEENAHHFLGYRG
jgi:hypothetical protein